MPVNPKQLQEHALQAERHLEALATGLAAVGAPENITKSVSQMADLTRKVVSSLGDARGNSDPEQGADPEAAPEAAPAEAAPEAAPAPAEQPAAAPQPSPGGHGKDSIGSAAEALHAEVLKKAAAKNAQQ